MRLRCVAALLLLGIASFALAQTAEFVVSEGGSSGQTLALGTTRAASIKRFVTIEPKKEQPPAEGEQKQKAKPQTQALDLTKVRVELLTNSLQHANGFDYPAKFIVDGAKQDKRFAERSTHRFRSSAHTPARS